MDSELLTSGMDGSLMNLEQLIHPWNLPNRSRMALDAIFPEIPKDSVRHRHAALFGAMETGKTTTLNYLVQVARARYGDQLNVIACYSIERAMDLINSQKVQLIIVDDAISEANSRQGFKQAEVLAAFYEIRHLYEEVAKSNSGIVITVWSCQRFHSLDINYRQGQALIFKSTATDPADAKEIRNYIGNRAYTALAEITRRIFMDADDSAKGEAIVCFPMASTITPGIFRTPNVPQTLRFLDSDRVYEPKEAFVFNVGAVLERYRKDVKWSRLAKWYYATQVEQRSQAAIAAEMDLSESVISDGLKRMKGELARVAGADYETFKVNQLKRRGYDVKHLGGQSEADIIATMPGGAVTIVSCKCLDFDRVVKLPIREIAPELHKARELGAVLMVAIHNLHDHTDQERIVSVSEPPPYLIIKPLAT